MTSRMWTAAAAALLLAGCQDTRESQGLGEPASPGAGEGEVAMQRGASGMAQPTTVTGVLTEVGNEELQIRTRTGEQIDLSFGDGVQFTMNGQPVQPQMLEEGAQVRATYSAEGDSRQLLRLDVTQTGQPGMQEPGMRQPATGEPGMQQPGMDEPGMRPDQDGMQPGAQPR